MFQIIGDMLFVFAMLFATAVIVCEIEHFRRN